ncbi:MAG: proteasome subunit beta [Candidatus ainarchaeum sp.]|nr:proteasome subunit beta [Candidatus ainarchaeum sp.]MDD3975982.1 proteasome subunit beta [Candidatus ainarchaeum sp.]
MSEDIKFMKGTTTLGIVAKDGIVLAADMKASMGNFVADTSASKIYTINDHIALTLAGSQGDALTLIRHLRNNANLYELEHKRPLSTKSCVALLTGILNSNKFRPFYTQFIIGGTDGELHSLDMVGGSSKTNSFAVSGSGSELAISVLDNKYTPNITVKDAISLAKEGISAAKKRDIYSGGDGINIFVIKNDSIEELPISKYKE